MSEKKEPVEVTVFKCHSCNKAYVNIGDAKKCCKECFCKKCNKKVPKYFTFCRDCMEENRLENAEKISLVDYEKKYPECPLVIGETFYFDQSLLMDDYCDVDEKPKFAWAAHKIDVGLRIDHPVNVLEDEGVDFLDFSKEAYKEYEVFAKKWNEKHGKFYYAENSMLAVSIPHEFWE